MRNSLKNRALRVILVVTGIALMGCASSSFFISDSSLVKGNYTANDFVDGNLKITNVTAGGGTIRIFFNNDRTLAIKNDFGYPVKEKKEVVVIYRGHRWKKNKNFVIINEVCPDDHMHTFYMKFTADIIVKDCEKTILSFKCDKLLVQNNNEARFEKRDIFGNIIGNPKTKKQEVNKAKK